MFGRLWGFIWFGKLFFLGGLGGFGGLGLLGRSEVSEFGRLRLVVILVRCFKR